MPRMSTADRTAMTIGSDQTGMQVYDTDTKSIWIYDGTQWARGGRGGTTLVGTSLIGANAGPGGTGTSEGTTLNINNNFLGAQSGWSNTTGFSNNFMGTRAGASNTSGKYNNFLGFESGLYNTTGDSNNFMGMRAGASNTSGRYNNFLGFESGLYNTLGSYNIAIGSYSGRYVSGGTSLNQESNTSLFLGRETKSGASSSTNEIVIGDSAEGLGSNTVRMGNTSISGAYIQVAWNITSDKKWKQNISSLPYGLNLIKALRPVEYTRKNAPQKGKEMGFIAQEVETALDQVGFKDYGFLEKHNNGYNLRYNDFIALSVKAIQEQQVQIDKLQAENDALKTKAEQDEKLLHQLLKRVEALER